MKTNVPVRTIVATLILLTASLASAELVVSKAIVTFADPLNNREDIEVLNTSPDETLYVSVEGYEVVNPGTDQEKMVPIGQSLRPEFVATPNKLAIGANGRSLVRLLNLNRVSEAERIYRINFLPIARPPELVEPTEGEDVIQPALDIIIAYQVLAIVLPENPAPEVSATRDGTSVLFTNEGSSNYLVSNGLQCNPELAADCDELPSRRIYPGNQWRMELPYDGPFSYSIKTHDGNFAKSFD